MREGEDKFKQKLKHSQLKTEKSAWRNLLLTKGVFRNQPNHSYRLNDDRGRSPRRSTRRTDGNHEFVPISAPRRTKMVEDGRRRNRLRRARRIKMMANARRRARRMRAWRRRARRMEMTADRDKDGRRAPQRDFVNAGLGVLLLVSWMTKTKKMGITVFSVGFFSKKYKKSVKYLLSI